MSDFTSPTDAGHGASGAGESRDAGFTRGATERFRIRANGDQALTHHLRVDPSRSMKAITGEVEALLDGLEEGQRRGGALLASELIAQVIGRVPDWNGESVALTIQLRADAVRLEATGPVAPAIQAPADHDMAPDDPVADWGAFLIDRLADRWGLDGGSRRNIWAEIEAPA
jgi:hypothetical protein